MDTENQTATNSPEQIINSSDFSELTPITISNTNRGSEIKLRSVQDLRIHPLLKQFNEPMRRDERDVLFEDIKLRGIIVPIQINQFGEIIDGVHRWEQATRAGLALVPTQEFIFANDIAQELHILKSNGLRKTISTQHKYLSIARASKLFEVGRGGDRSKSKETPDTSLKNDVLTMTAKHMHVSPEVVKIARRYEKEILKHPEFHQVEPTKFLKSILPLTVLQNSIFKKTLVQYVVEENKDLSSVDMSPFELFDSLISKCKDQKKQLSASVFILEKISNRQKILAEDLAYKLGLSKDSLESEMGGNDDDAGSDEAQSSETADSSKSNPEGVADSPSSIAQRIFSDLIKELGSRVGSLEGAAASYKKTLRKISEFSTDYTVSIRRLCEYCSDLKPTLDRVNSVQEILLSLRNEFEDTGFQQSWDDRLGLFDANEFSDDTEEEEEESADNENPGAI